MTAERVEPEWAMATIVFVDIRGFTAFADKATAREAAAYLTAFFELALPILAAHGSRLTKLLGDGMLTVFGAPERQSDHADRALAGAIDLLGAVDAALGERCQIGIGINSGLVLVGTMGAAGVVGLEVVGDPVNVASRVEGATRDFGEPLLLTEATRLMLDRPAPELVSWGTIPLRGKAAPVAVHGLARDPVTISGRPSHTTDEA
ncbi:MAG: adenylate cyclase [Thermoleophilaceae bacterium]|nr:adenylate cyclase [Thermoleophilaceae bacterium]